MAIFKCKMCGGDLNISEGITVAECEYCGTKQTVSKTNDEVISNFFNRANNLRLKCEFDKAEQIYEKILDIDSTECEAHWGIVLCKYGIEYVEDPSTLKRIPTCHRTLYEAVTTDANYLAAVENADAAQKQLYMQEAAVIDALQKDILNIVNGEKPFDVFICYKETDENGNRTTDSVIANDIYHQLTQEGFKVFYAAITLEDKLGQEYEPYIFAALNSAKVMLVVGTKPQYFDAVWVRNEWSRYLKVMKNDRNKLLIPCYKDMDAYELPEAFAHLQAQDMGKIGFINDVVRGIKKVVSPNEQPATQAAITPAEPPTNIAPLLERAFMFLEDGEFNRADEFCEQVLNLDPKCARAYLGKLMAELHVKTKEQLADCKTPFDDKISYQKIIRFADEKTVKTISEYNETVIARKKALDEERENIAKKCKKRELKIIAIFISLAFIITFVLTSFNFTSWTDIVAVSAGNYHTVGLKKDGTVVAVGWNSYGQCDTDDWTDIVAVSAGDYHTVGLKKDGTVVAGGRNDYGQCDTDAWTDIVAISAGFSHTVGLKKDGTVVAGGLNGFGKSDTENWTDIVAISAGDYHTVGLKKDGTVVAVGANCYDEYEYAYEYDYDYGQCETGDWTDIVAISAGDYHTVGLKKDGTVVAVGDNDDGQCETGDWIDIVAISAGGYHTIGLKKDGTVVTVGDNDDGQCNTDIWKGFFFDIIAMF